MALKGDSRSRHHLTKHNESLHNVANSGQFGVTEAASSSKPADRNQKFEDEFNRFFAPAGGMKNKSNKEPKRDSMKIKEVDQKLISN